MVRTWTVSGQVLKGISILSRPCTETLLEEKNSAQVLVLAFDAYATTEQLKTFPFSNRNEMTVRVGTLSIGKKVPVLHSPVEHRG